MKNAKDANDAASRASAKAEKAYQERDHVIALAAHLAYRQGLEVWWGRVSDPMPGFQYALYITLPTGQVSWHMQDNELPLFRTLPFETGQWKRPSTRDNAARDKYARIAEYCSQRLTGGVEW